MSECSIYILLTLFLITNSEAFSCKKFPLQAESPKPNYNRYIIEIADNPDDYSPGLEYTIYLKSSPSNPIINNFTKFMIVVEPEQTPDAGTVVDAGDLSPVDPSITRFTSECPNAVIQTNDLAKSNVEILWKAPTSGNGCVYFKARVFESSDTWFNEDGDLTKKFCEEKENKDVQSPALETCGACHEAKYEVAFQGMWTRNTHPADYPPNMWSTKLGEIIGASHKYSKSFWDYNTEASEGLKVLATEGNTILLENELKQQVKDDDIRTIIKARELSYPNITGISYTVFRVDKEHHLISLVSKITPSPDWVVGVASMELCTEDGDWLKSRTLNLYPYDVGADDGITYNALDSPSSGKTVITQITPDNENYVPFYDKESKPIKPIAQLKITRQKVYEKECEEDPCEVTEWSEWSSCSNTCGAEVKTRDRSLKNPENEEQCKVVLQEDEKCENPESCESNDCANAEWELWSSCSVSCGTGSKTRTGTLPEDKEQSCEETVECTMPPCEDEATDDRGEISSESQIKPITQGPSYYNVVDCVVSGWSDWGPCIHTKSCHNGYRSGLQYKERHILTHPSNGGKACVKKLRKSKRCRIPCGNQCTFGPWSNWSPCSHNCGPDAVRQRTRIVVKGPKSCGPRVEEQKCPFQFKCEGRNF